MKICNNCNTENQEEANKCAHCQMAHNFRPKGDGLLATPHHSDEHARQCLNCGHPQPGEGPKCTHCHFPLPDGEKPVRAVPHPNGQDMFSKHVLSKKSTQL